MGHLLVPRPGGQHKVLRRKETFPIKLIGYKLGLVTTTTKQYRSLLGLLNLPTIPDRGLSTTKVEDKVKGGSLGPTV